MQLTRNVTKALAVLMVDFSCALKLSMPISVLSAIREAGSYHITVKGGKYLEAVAEANTIVFDKTGTLTKAKPAGSQGLHLLRQGGRRAAVSGGLSGGAFPSFYGKGGWFLRRQKKVWSTKKPIPRWNISLHTALHLP